MTGHFTFCSAPCEQWDCPQHKSNADPEDFTLKWSDFRRTCPDYTGLGLVNSEELDK